MKKILCTVLLFATALCFAKEFKPHMVSASSMGAANFTKEYSNYDLDTININAGYFYAINKYIQLGGELSYTILHSFADTLYTVAPGVIFNYAYNPTDGIEDSFFAHLSTGWSGATGYGEGATQNFYALDLGKRFSLLENVSYSPSILMVYSPDSENSDPSFHFNFLKLTIHF